MIRDEVKEQQKKLEGKTFNEKLQYFWYYYKVHAFAVLFTIIALSLFISAVLKDSKEPSIYVALINSNLASEQDTTLLSDYVSSRNIDTEEHPAKMDFTMHMSADSVDDASMASSQKYMSMLSTGKADVILCDKWIIDEYAILDAYENLETYLKPEDYEKIKDNLYYREVNEKGKIPVAFYATDVDKILTDSLYGKKDCPLIAICRTSKRKETAADFIHYLLESGK